mgnify:CR=1 FL=1
MNILAKIFGNTGAGIADKLAGIQDKLAHTKQEKADLWFYLLQFV